MEKAVFLVSYYGASPDFAWKSEELTSPIPREALEGLCKALLPPFASLCPCEDLV